MRKTPATTTLTPVSSAQAEINNAANAAVVARGRRQALTTFYCGRCRALTDRTDLKELKDGLLVCRKDCAR